MMNREEATELVRRHVTRKNLFNHILAVEAIMRAMAVELGEDEEVWAIAGLLHDADFDETYNDPANHGKRSVEILNEEAFGKVPEEIIHAIKAHNPEYTGVEPETKMEYALLAADAVSGLIVAAALIIPSKKLADVHAENIIKRFKEKDFARNCNRENMTLCEKAGMPSERFFEIALKALQGISDQLGL
jgi:putative nucleotidyltransferase with HDIG domain